MLAQSDIAKDRTCRFGVAGMMMLVACLVAGRAPARAESTIQASGDDPVLGCLANTTGTVSVTPQTIHLGESVTVRWTVRVPANCTSVVQTLNGQAIGRSGSMMAQPMANASYTLRARYGGTTRTLATTMMQVQLPQPVHITAGDQAPLLVQALGTPGQTIHIESHVEVDLSHRDNIAIASGVQLTGGRTPQVAGARLYTTSFPRRLFRIGMSGNAGGDVHITGLRIDGGEMGVADAGTDTSMGITIESWLNVEIDNNELYGWRGAAIEVRDDHHRISRITNPMSVRIHDNYIHHNQRQRGEGYGVAVTYGAYALIEKNVFDWNRHAIASDGREGSGYLAYRNLVLEHGGLNYWIGDWIHTHMFDMHGRDNCMGVEYYCGPAGDYMDIRFNSFLYASGDAFKLRGTPSIRADVAHNVFKHRAVWSSYSPIGGIINGALDQTESGLIEWDNRADVDESDNHGLCDFDGDGMIDRFFATGATWWYSSAGTGHWTYLNTSTKRLSELTLEEVDGDGRCDVIASGLVSSGGRGPWRVRLGGILWQNNSGELAVWSLDQGGIVSESYPGRVDNSWQVRYTGDFNADGHDDILWQNTSGQVAIWYMTRGTHIGDAYPGGQVAVDWKIQGVGDFDGDGRADILWRDAGGQLAIWFGGDLADPLYPAVYPGYGGSPAPVDLSWQVKGIGDFNGDGRSDILWRHTNGQVAMWHMAGGIRIGEAYPGGQDPGMTWTIQGVGDFDADGRSDVLWRDAGGQLAVWPAGSATGAGYPSYNNLGAAVDPAWVVQGIADYNGDARADILWRHSDGQVAVWFMAGARFLGDAYPRMVDQSWRVRAVLTYPR